MSERLVSVKWADTDEGVRVKAAYNDWLTSKLGSNPNLSFVQTCKMQHTFFDEQYENLQLSERGQQEVYSLQRGVAQYLESQPMYNLVSQAI